MKNSTKLWIWILLLVFLTPLGLILPEYFKSGAAWGEWGLDEIQKLAGYIPKGLEKLSGLWNAPIPDYAFKGQKEGLAHSSFAYIISAVIGISLTVILAILIGKKLTKKDD